MNQFSPAELSPDGELMSESMRSRYDFIVCGGGTTGSVVARRLAEDPNVSILLIEAGGSDCVPQVIDSTQWMWNIGTSRDWGYKAASSKTVNGRTPLLPMGKVLGGGSSINSSVWARGHMNDFNNWAAASGEEGWNYDNIFKVYCKIEDWQGTPEAKRRGQGRLLNILQPENPFPLVAGLIKGAEPETTMGPLSSSCQLQKVMGYLDEGKTVGAETVIGGGRIGESGFFMEPTILAGTTDDMSVLCGEIFGPVLACQAFAAPLSIKLPPKPTTSISVLRPRSGPVTFPSRISWRKRSKRAPFGSTNITFMIRPCRSAVTNNPVGDVRRALKPSAPSPKSKPSVPHSKPDQGQGVRVLSDRSGFPLFLQDESHDPFASSWVAEHSPCVV